MTQVFISYARKDHHFVERLRADFQSNKVAYWIDKEGLSPGTRNWERAIRQAIAESYAVVWVVSPASYDSEYVSSELAVAEMHNLKIYPVWANGDNWIACVPLGKHNIQFVDMRRDDYEDGLAKLFEAIGGSKPEIAIPEPEIPTLPAGKEPRNPYKGLSAFTEKDVGDFYGRERLITKLKTHIEIQLTNNADRFLTVLGPSGAGKSSVVMAGLLPTLRKEYSNWHILPRIVPGTNPVEVLADALYSAMPDKSLSAIETDLNSAGGRMLHRLSQQLEAKQVVIYIDQFEELFTLTTDEDERQQFIDLITHASTEPDGKVIIVLSMRADFYGHPMNYPQLGRLVNQNSEAVLPMSIVELRDAIEKPVRLPKVGLHFDDRLVAEIIFALRERDKALAGALPLLQFTLERLFAERDGTHLTWSAYNKLGDPEKGISGVEGAIGTHCEEVFSQLTDSAQEKLGQIFLSLLSIDENTGEVTRRRAELDVVIVDEDSKTFVDSFINNRLFQTGYDGEQVYLEITHEALFRSWGRLHNWIKGAQEDLILLRQMRNAAQDWDSKGRPDYLRWNHERLKLVYVMQEKLLPELSDVEEFFIESEQERLYRELEDINITHQRRFTIGERLGAIGDIRKGVSLKDNLPDIDWLPIDLGGNILINDQTFVVSPFFIAKYMTTFEQFQRFLDSEWKDSEWWRGFPESYSPQYFENVANSNGNAPRDTVSWYQSVAFSRWVNEQFQGMELTFENGDSMVVGVNAEIRLPTEQEWQWVGQNGTENRDYPWGEWDKYPRANTLESGINNRSMAVGMYPQGQAKCGGLDMSGNLWEWCLNDYGNPKVVNSFDNREYKVLRGGSRASVKHFAHISYRFDNKPSFIGDSYGFRLVVSSILSI